MVMAPSDTLLLQSILDRIGTLDEKVEHIAERQAVIAERVDTHIAQTPLTAPESKSGIMSVLNVLKQWILPIIMAVYLLGRQSVEYTKPVQVYPPRAVISSQVDDTFVANKNRKIDSMLIKQIMKGIGGS